MTDEKWAETVGFIKEKFKVIEDSRREIEEIPRAFAEIIIFEGPTGRVKLERAVQPAVLDRKTIYSKLAGRASKVEYVYSDTEMISKLRAYHFNEASGEWDEIKTAGTFSF